MNKYFLDFGTNFGQGLDTISRIENFSKDIEIHSFEANPFVFQKINFKSNVNYYNLAVSDFNGFSEFNVDGTEGSGGSTLLKLENFNVEPVYGWKEGERYDWYKTIKVYSMCISDIMQKLLPNKKERSVIAKFDVEGSEYKIFKKLQETDNLKWFSKIYVEFHDRCMVKNQEKGANYWIRHFHQNNIKTILWR